MNQEQSKYELVSFIVIGIAIIAKLGLGVFFRVRAKKLSSLALKNSGTDALFDAILSTGTFIAMFISYYANVYIEGYIGILIGLFIIKSGISAMIESLSPILGERIDDKLAAEIKSEICTHPEVKGAYDLIVNSYGENKRIGSVHVEVDDKLTIQEFHSIERQIQIYMYDKHGIIMTIGVYASNDSSPKAKELKAWALKCCGEEKDIIQVHGFYFDDEQRFVTLDIIVNFDSKEEPQDIANRVKNKIEAQYPELAIYVNIDQDFSN